MSIGIIVLLAVIQGLTEFLPVSSSGHLVLAQKLLKMDDPEANMTLNIFLHVGSLGAILVYFGRDFLRLLTTRRREIGLLVIGSVPAVAALLFLEKGLKIDRDEALSIPILTAFLLVGNGFFLMIVDRIRRPERPLDGKRALGVGLAQVAGIFPGISRSGSTIGTGMLLGLSPKEAVRFSFLLGAVAIFGAGLLETKDLLDAEGGQVRLEILPILVGAGVSFAVSLAAIRAVAFLAEKRKLRWFGMYCVGVGLIALGFVLFCN